jgi:hypothetical protein
MRCLAVCTWLLVTLAAALIATEPLLAIIGWALGGVAAIALAVAKAGRGM